MEEKYYKPSCHAIKPLSFIQQFDSKHSTVILNIAPNTKKEMYLRIVPKKGSDRNPLAFDSLAQDTDNGYIRFH